MTPPLVSLFLAAALPALAKAPPKKPIRYPPIVLMGAGRLDCRISAKENGRQTLALFEGSGIGFDAEVTPILDGEVRLKKPGMNYRFTSNLVKPVKARATGLGEVLLLEMRTAVSVDVSRYEQPGGPGTEIRFGSADMEDKGMYVEFRGVLEQASSGQRFAFRTVMGPPTDGGGAVFPETSDDVSRLVAKTVVVVDKPLPVKPFSQITTTLEELEPER